MSALTDRGISRRRFLGFASAMTALLALPQTMTPQIVKALETQRKPVVVWLEFQDCAGNTESLLRSSHPAVADIVLDVLSWEYHETIMAAAGHQAEAVLERVKTGTDPYMLIVEGSIPTAEDGDLLHDRRQDRDRDPPGDGGQRGARHRRRRLRLGRRLPAPRPDGRRGGRRDHRQQAPHQPRRLPPQRRRTRLRCSSTT